MTLKGMVLNTASSPFSASMEELLSSYADMVRAGTGGYLRYHCQGIDQGFYRSIKHVMWIKETTEAQLRTGRLSQKEIGIPFQVEHATLDYPI